MSMRWAKIFSFQARQAAEGRSGQGSKRRLPMHRRQAVGGTTKQIGGEILEPL